MFQSNNVDSYGIQNSAVNTDKLWITSTQTNIVFTSYIPGQFMTLQLLKNIPQTSYLYTISVPIAMTIKGKCSKQIQDPRNIVSRLNQAVKLIVYYSGKKVTLPVQPIITLNNANLTMNIDINNNHGGEFIANDSVFSATQYIGMMTVSNLFLYTSDNYNYQIFLEFDVNLNNFANFGSEQPTLGVIVNYVGQNIEYNTVLLSQTTSEPNTGFSFTGI
jgi:hypothetical protein